MKCGIFAVAGLLVALAGTAYADNTFSVKPWVYDPDNTGIAASAWVTGTGLPDAGSSAHALYLAKMGPTATNAAGGATILGASGITLTELGFDVRTDGHCGAGAPRFNVTTSDGVTHFFGCAYGTHTPIAGHPDWETVSFSAADAFPPYVPGSTVTDIEIVFDEGTDQGQGYVYLDNIDVNGAVMGKPGNGK